MSPDWIAVLEKIHSRMVGAQKEGSGLWFRGQGSGWDLRSKLHRIQQRHFEAAGPLGPETTADKRGLLRGEDRTVFRLVESQASLLLSPHERGPWTLLFWMQHYGIPTRLLDWTRSFGTALFFALNSAEPPEDSCCVWA
jgi:FRG domain